MAFLAEGNSVTRCSFHSGTKIGIMDLQNKQSQTTGERLASVVASWVLEMGVTGVCEWGGGGGRGIRFK